MAWYRTKEYDEERFKQLNPIARGMISLGTFVTGGRASAAGEEFRKKNEVLANAIYYTPTGQMYAGTKTQNERAAENVIKQGGQLYTQEAQTLDEREDVAGVPDLNLSLIDWGFAKLDDELKGGIKGFTIAVVIIGVVIFVFLIYLLIKGVLSLNVR